MGELLRQSVPSLAPELASLVAAFGRLGRDMNGGIPYAERVALRCDLEIDSPGEVEAFDVLLDAYEHGISEGRTKARDETTPPRGRR